MYSDRRGLRRVTNDGRSHGPVWSPDGSRLLFLHHKKEDSAVFQYSVRRLGVDTDIGILDSDRGEPLEESLGPGFIPQAAWSPDGKSVAVDFRPAPRRAWTKPAFTLWIWIGPTCRRLSFVTPTTSCGLRMGRSWRMWRHGKRRIIPRYTFRLPMAPASTASPIRN